MAVKKDEAFEVRNEEIEETLNGIAQAIVQTLPKGWGFSLQIFSFGKKGSNFYASNARREDIIKLMKEFIAREEKK